jgi:hypothetical protein
VEWDVEGVGGAFPDVHDEPLFGKGLVGGAADRHFSLEGLAAERRQILEEGVVAARGQDLVLGQEAPGEEDGHHGDNDEDDALHHFGSPLSSALFFLAITKATAARIMIPRISINRPIPYGGS